MANSLLDFVMSVVRDPDAAAAYAANPGQAIADAHLTDVTSVDVDNLIPVVAESFSSAMPAGGFSGGLDGLGDAAHNVWASGAATAAFDAFDDHLPLQGGDVIAAQVPIVAGVIDHPADVAPTIVDHVIDDGSLPTVVDPVLSDVAAFDDVHLVDAVSSDDPTDAGVHGGDTHLEQAHDQGFDLF